MWAEQEEHTATAQLLRQHATRQLAEAKAKAAAAAEEGLPEGVGLAARLGDECAVAAWLDEGGSVDAGCAERDGATVLMAATQGGQGAVVRMLQRRGRQLGRRRVSRIVGV